MFSNNLGTMRDGRVTLDGRMNKYLVISLLCIM